MPKKLIKRILKLLLGLLALPVMYFLVALLLTFISVNNSFKPEPTGKGITVYLLSNEVHTDIVLPLKPLSKGAEVLVNPLFTSGADTTCHFVAYGWGDKGFYLNTKTWGDLKFSTAFDAVFYRGSSAMHVTFYTQLKENKNCVRLLVSSETYLNLLNTINKSFKCDANKAPIIIQGACYNTNDCFYEANGTYGLFNTCNTWANSVLKDAGLKACLWTPFSFGILSKYN